MPENTFSWPSGKRSAISLTFDDARPSQLENGLPLFDRYGVKATFYVRVDTLQLRLRDWIEVARSGHEIGNHTFSHPCTGNFSFSRTNPLENYSLPQMEEELVRANEAITELLGVTPTTFAYPCGQTFVGRGAATRSYVPLVARHFLAGRGFRDERANMPDFCDLSQLLGVNCDNLSWPQMQTMVEQARDAGGWFIFAAHDIGAAARQTASREVLNKLCRYIQDPAQGLWVDTVANVAAYVRQQRP